MSIATEPCPGQLRQHSYAVVRGLFDTATTKRLREICERSCPGQSQRYRQRAIQLFIDNLHRFVKGEPLANVVDKEKGY